MKSMTPPDALYEQDFLAWTEMMAAALEDRRVADLDWAHLAEEIRDLGISQKHALKSHLENVQLHLIKWEIQPARRLIRLITTVYPRNTLRDVSGKIEQRNLYPQRPVSSCGRDCVRCARKKGDRHLALLCIQVDY